MKFIRLLSRKGRQTFTYECVNSIGWQDDGGSFDKAIQLMGANEEVITHSSTDPRISLMGEDGCRVRKLRPTANIF